MPGRRGGRAGRRGGAPPAGLRASRRLGRLGHPPSCASGPAWPGARRHPCPAFWARTGRLHAPDGRMKPLPRGLATPGSEISSRVRPAAAPSGRRPLKTRPARATGRRPPRGPPGAGLERRGGRGRPSRHMWARAGCAGVGGRSTRASTEGEGQAVATVDGRIRVTRAVLNRFQMERGLESVAQPKLSLWDEGSIASTGGLVTKVQEETLTAVAADSPVYTVQLSAVPPHTTTNTVFP